MTRGDVFRIHLPGGRGHQQAGRRYGVVVHANELAGLSTAIVVPTSKSATPATFRPEVEVKGERTRVLAEQILALDLGKLGDLAGRLSLREIGAVDDAVRLVLALR